MPPGIHAVVGRSTPWVWWTAGTSSGPLDLGPIMGPWTVGTTMSL